MEAEVRQRLRKILKTLKDFPSAAEFASPVNWKKLRLPDYPKLITHPMDLGTIGTKLDENRYSSPQEFWSDVDLIWHNCRLYNQEDSPIFAECIEVQALANSLRLTHFPVLAAQAAATPLTTKHDKIELTHASTSEVKDEKSPSMAISEEERLLREHMRLAHRMSLLRTDQLGTVVQFLQSQEATGFSKSTCDVSVVIAVDRLSKRHQKTLNCLVKALIREQNVTQPQQAKRIRSSV